MNTIELLNQFKAMGVQLSLNGGNIRYYIPEPEVKAHPELDRLLLELKAHKSEALQLLQQPVIKPVTQKKAWIEPELKPVRAILLWSEKLQDHFWWVLDKSVLPEVQKDGIPIYDSQEIDIMLDAKDDQERKQLHAFKKIFGAKIYKAKGR